MAETVILVPGIGFGGLELVGLSRKLRQSGYFVRIFWNNPWRAMAESAAGLRQMLADQQTATTHFVAHSLGGVIALQMLHDYPEEKVGRVVLLGTPIAGCLAARRVHRIPGGRWVLGQALASACSKTAPPIPRGCEVGSIAGRLNFLLGLVLCPYKPNDTLVCVEETRHPNLSDHCVLFVSHTSMLFSRQVSERILFFLRNGVFTMASGSEERNDNCL